VGGRNGKKGFVEGFRVLTLLYRVSELPAGAFQRLVELFRVYRAAAALYWWSKRLNLDEGVELALERARQLLPYYYRKAFDEESRVYQFSEVERMKRPRKMILQLPLVDALHPNHSCYIKDGKLVVRLGNGERLELPLPECALEWLQEKEREVAPLKVTKTVRVQWREDKPEHLKVQTVLRVERPEPRMPDPRGALLAYVDANSDYGIACVLALSNGAETKVLETPKLRPPNRSRRLREAAWRKQAAARGRKPNVNYALARLSERFRAKGWVKAAAARIFKKAFKRASGRSVIMNFDIPDPESIKGSYLQKTLLSLRKIADNLAKWFGIYVTFECYPSTKCPFCGSKLKIVYTKRTRIAFCTRCGFFEDRDFVPFYHWVKALGLPLPKWPLRKLQLPEELKLLINSVRPESPRAWLRVGGVAPLAPPRRPCARRAHPADAGMRLGAEPRVQHRTPSDE
jgi:transposase